MMTYWAILKDITNKVLLLRTHFGHLLIKIGPLLIPTSGHTDHYLPTYLPTYLPAYLPAKNFWLERFQRKCLIKTNSKFKVQQSVDYWTRDVWKQLSRIQSLGTEQLKRRTNER